MIIGGVDRDRCSRCLCGIVEGDYTIVLGFDNGFEAVFCFECGIKEMAHATEKSIPEIEKHWRETMNIDKLFDTPPIPQEIHHEDI